MHDAAFEFPASFVPYQNVVVRRHHDRQGHILFIGDDKEPLAFRVGLIAIDLNGYIGEKVEVGKTQSHRIFSKDFLDEFADRGGSLNGVQAAASNVFCVFGEESR